MAMLWIHIHQKYRPGESQPTRRGVVAGAQAQTELDKAFIYAACRLLRQAASEEIQQETA